MGGQPCALKALMNGTTIYNESLMLMKMIDAAAEPISDAAGYKIVECLNHAEDLIFKAKRAFLESQGFKGTEEQGGWPNSLKFKEK